MKFIAILGSFLLSVVISQEEVYATTELEVAPTTDETNTKSGNRGQRNSSVGSQGKGFPPQGWRQGSQGSVDSGFPKPQGVWGPKKDGGEQKFQGRNGAQQSNENKFEGKPPGGFHQGGFQKGQQRP